MQRILIIFWDERAKHLVDALRKVCTVETYHLELKREAFQNYRPKYLAQ
jgi:hypothetical protein